MSLDYMIGRRVVAISRPLQKSDWTWAVELEDGIRIVHTGTTKKPSNTIENTALGTVVEDDTGTTIMGFYGGSEPTLVETVAAPTDSLKVEYPEGYDVPQVPIQSVVDPSVDLPDDPS